MKAGIHPKEYRPVVFQDNITGWKFLTRSTIKTSKTIKWEDGNDYDLAVVEISSASHPFYTGKTKFIDSEGRVERFQNKYSGNYATQKKIKKPKLEKMTKIKKLKDANNPAQKKADKKVKKEKTKEK